MHNAKPQQTHRNLWDTPQKRAYLNSTQLRFLDTLHSPDADRVAKTMAWANYRTERFTETGLEGLTGPDATYHLPGDFAGHLVGMAHLLAHSEQTDAKVTTERLLYAAQRAVGWRWGRGVEGLLASLESRGAPREQCVIFTAERDAFWQRYASLINAAGTLLDERLTAPALATSRRLVVTLIDEARHLADWLELAGKPAEAHALRTSADGADADLATEQRG